MGAYPMDLMEFNLKKKLKEKPQVVFEEFRKIKK